MHDRRKRTIASRRSRCGIRWASLGFEHYAKTLLKDLRGGFIGQYDCDDANRVTQINHEKDSGNTWLSSSDDYNSRDLPILAWSDLCGPVRMQTVIQHETAGQRIAGLARFWTVALVAAPFAGVYFLLFYWLPDSIKVFGELEFGSSPLVDDGVSILFSLTSAVLGWATVAALERRADLGRYVLFLAALPFWAVTLGLGFWGGLAGRQDLGEAASILFVFCVLSVVCVGALRAYLSEVM